MSLNVTNINGSTGKYTNVISDKSVSYGRNAMNNYINAINSNSQSEKIEFPDLTNLATLPREEYEKKMAQLDECIKKLQAQKPPFIDFKCQYMPIKLDKKALMAAAYEEMGGRRYIPVSEATKLLQETVDLVCEDNGPKMSAKALDINGDNNIDIAEHSTSILLADALSKDTQTLGSENIDGTFTNKGENAMLPYYKLSNYEIASKTFQSIYKAYGLDKAQEEFLSNPNNTINF